MKKISLFNSYELKARYLPTFLSVMPLAHLLIKFFGNVFWQEILISIDWMLIVANISVSVVIMLTLIQVQTSLAKHWIEETVFGNNGLNFPSTDMLLYNSSLISVDRKEQIRNKIINEFGCNFSTEAEEVANPQKARLQAREAVGFVRRYVGNGVMTLQYNIRYGFFRNLFGGMIWNFFGLIGCSIIYGISKNWKVMSLFIALFFIYLFLFILKKKILEKLAYAYADTLFNEFIIENKGEKND